MEPIYHNFIFLVVTLVAVSSSTDLLQPRWKLRRRQPRKIKEILRQAGENKTATQEWFSEREIREVRKGGTIGLAISLSLIVGLQPDIGWLGTSVRINANGDADLIARVRPKLERLARRTAIIGATLVVVADGKEAIIGLGRRDLHTSEPPDGNTLYEIGSISKTFTGTLLAHEIRNGRAKLDDPANSHLPAGIRLPDTVDAPVLLRACLQTMKT